MFYIVSIYNSIYYIVSYTPSLVLNYYVVLNVIADQTSNAPPKPSPRPYPLASPNYTYTHTYTYIHTIYYIYLHCTIIRDNLTDVLRNRNESKSKTEIKYEYN